MKWGVHIVQWTKGTVHEDRSQFRKRLDSPGSRAVLWLAAQEELSGWTESMGWSWDGRNSWFKIQFLNRMIQRIFVCLFVLSIEFKTACTSWRTAGVGISTSAQRAGKLRWDRWSQWPGQASTREQKGQKRELRLRWGEKADWKNDLFQEWGSHPLASTFSK